MKPNRPIWTILAMLAASQSGGAAFGAFLASENARIRPILTDMGLVK